MGKLGLISVYNHNYGSLLQSYALQQELNSRGIDNEIIFYQKRDVWKQFKRLFNIPLVIAKGKVVYRQMYCRTVNRELGTNLNIRDAEFEKFVLKYLNRSTPYIGWGALTGCVSNYYAFLLGSDQVWNPTNMGTDYYTLNWIPDGIKKATYAPSFGVSSIPRSQKKKTSEFLNRIDFLSTREESGARIIYDLTGRKAEVVCDPTLVVDIECWEKLKGGTPFVKGKYIFCYFLGSNPLHREFAKHMKEHTGYKLVALQHLDELVKADFDFADEKPFDVGPAEFVNLIANAEFVLTDSFHGTVFSILYKKKFFTLNRYAQGKKESTNSRTETLLSIMQISDRKITGSEPPESVIERPINYETVQDRLEKYRAKSREYLDMVLGELSS